MNVIIDVIREVTRQCDEAKEAYNKTGNATDFGQLLAFAEVLSIFQDYFRGEEELEKLLDYDIDRRYLNP